MNTLRAPSRLRFTREGVFALLAGLYLSRIGAEFVLPPVPLVGAVGGLLLGAGGVMWVLNRQDAKSARFPGLFTLLLVPYLLYPYQDPRLALACGLLAGIAWAAARWRVHNGWIDAGVFVVALLLYGLTLAPGVQPADGGEFQLVIAEWGVAHPPGYPLYTILGGVLARLLPVGAMAWRVNLFSALTGALTLAVACRAVRRETGSGPAGIVAAGVLGVATSFWTTSTQASIRPMTALFMALMIEAALAYRRAVTVSNCRVAANAKNNQTQLGDLGVLAVQKNRYPASGWALVRFGLAAGLGVTHHASLVFPGGILALALLAVRPGLIRQPRLWGQALLAALAGTIPWGYLLLRGAAGATLAPANLTTWDGFWGHVLAFGFAGDMFYYRALPDVLGRLGMIGQVLDFQWHGLILLLALFALILLIWRDRWLALALGGAFGLHTLVAATYRAPQTVEYMIPAYVCLAVGVGWAVGEVGRLEPPGRQERHPEESSMKTRVIRTLCALLESSLPHQIVANMLPALAAVSIVWSGWPTWITLRAYQWRDPTEANARAVLEAAPPDAVILANWHHVTPLWTLQAAGLRPDVEARYVFPMGAEPILDTWARLIAEGTEDGRPLITCSYYPEVFRHTGRTFSALESCWQVDPAVPIVAVARRALLDDLALFAGPPLPQTMTAGEATFFALNWHLPADLDYGELTSFVHLVDEAGDVLAQDDQPLYAPNPEGMGIVLADYSVAVPRTVPAGTYRLLVGAYRNTPDGPQMLQDAQGQERIELGRIQVHATRLPPVSGHERHVPLGDDLLLVGHDYDLSVPGRARLYLHWRIIAPRPDGGLTLLIRAGDHELARAAIRSAEPGFLTTAHDLPDVDTVDGLWFEVWGEEEALWARGMWGLPLASGVWLPGPASGDRYIPIGDVVVTGYTVEPAAEPGAEVSAVVAVRGTTALIQDMSVKLALGEAAQTDGTPVGGAIPTLKWGWGATLTDTLRVTWPDDALADPGPLTLTFYDTFTGRVWPVFDPAFNESGPGLPLMP